ncbi:hypothetical protein [Streptomyces sp. NPDC023588]|uniref:AMIN-like domain-containing (lipo)protein n=1 Tax=Streptomyces sp. NPDC023588 TaxID=3154907 RepID=UPI0033E80761
MKRPHPLLRLRPHRRRIAGLASGILLVAGLSFAAPASAAAPSTTTRTPLVVNARWAGHPAYDRIVIDLRAFVPTVTVTPVPQLRYDGSGAPVPLAGKHFLEIRLNPAAAHDEAGRSVYLGPKLQKINLVKLKGIALTGDYEGYVTFGAAFDTLPYYRAFSLHSPERLVVDIAH